MSIIGQLTEVFTTGNYRPIVLKKSNCPNFSDVDACENVFVFRRVKSYFASLC